jgi:hypothetical protein
MSHWTTSGRSRLKAKQNQSFSHRARQGAANVNHSVLPMHLNDVRECVVQKGRRVSQSERKKCLNIDGFHAEIAVPHAK